MLGKDHPLLRYAIGPLAIVIGLLIKAWAAPVLGPERPFLLLFAPIMLAAWYGGPGPGVVTTFLSAATADFFFIFPLHTFALPDRIALIQLSVFILEGLTMSSLSAVMHAAERRANQTERDIIKLNQELEHRVSERTAQLEKTNQELEREISERNRTEERLRRSEHQLALAQEIASIGSWDWDIAENKVAWSDELYRIFGLKPKSPEITYETFLDHVLPEDRPYTEQTIKRALSDHQPFSFYHRIVRPDGVIRTLHAQGEVILDRNRRPMKLIGTGQDITERKRAEEEQAQLIREQTARIEAEAAQRRLTFLSDASALLASSLDYETTLARVAQLAVPYLADWCIVTMAGDDGSMRPLAMAHVDPKKVRWAEEIQRRYPPDPNQSHGVPEVLRTGRSEIYPEIPDALLAATARDEAHLQILRKIGLQSAMIVPLIVQGQPVGVITFISAESGRRYNQGDLALAEDLARRAALAIENARLYRQAQEANRAKDEFLAVVSHELRTPLNAILGWSQLLREGEFDSETTRRGLESIARNASAQTQLIEDLLDVSRIVAGKLHLDLRQIEIVPVVQAAIDTVQSAADAKEITLTCRSADPSISVLGDPDRLQQVIWNLLSNAIKFTPEQGKVSVQVEQADLHVQIHVRDTGIGISPDFLPYVFDRFRQANSTSTRVHSGLGLGLAIVRHLVELHGGAVSVESPGEGKGAAFTITLPVRSVRTAEERRPPGSAKILRAPLDGVRILVVDDEADARDLVTAALRQCHAEVKAVSSAREAMNVLERERPDVLVSDIAMPQEDGNSLIRKVRALSPEQGGAIPAVALTAYAGEEDRRRILSSGFQEHLAKPIEPMKLVASVAKLAGRKRTAA